MAQGQEQLTTPSTEDGVDDIRQFDDGREHFLGVRERKERGAITVLHPHTREHVDLVDFDKEITQRQKAGLSGYNFWSTPLPRHPWLNRLMKTVVTQHNWIP
jgi:hypothetical protein